MYTPISPFPWDWSVQIWSLILGYSSIGFWICAQVPQVIENIRLQSCEGLALPFLLNWLFGDLCNLIGCLLTGQRAFQTWLATYFCLVDIFLTSQYVYYSKLVAKRRRLAALGFSGSEHDALVVERSRSRGGEGHYGIEAGKTRQEDGMEIGNGNGNGLMKSPSIVSNRATNQSQRHQRSSSHTQDTLQPSTSFHSHSHSHSHSTSNETSSDPSSSTITVRPLPNHHYRDASLSALQQAAMDIVRTAARIERSRSSKTRRSSHSTGTGGGESKNGSLERGGSGSGRRRKGVGVRSSGNTGGGGIQQQSSHRRDISGNGNGHSRDEMDDKLVESFHSELSSSSTKSEMEGKPSRKGKERSEHILPSPSLSPEFANSRGRSLLRPTSDSEEEGYSSNNHNGITSPQLRFIAEEDSESTDQANQRLREEESRHRRTTKGKRKESSASGKSRSRSIAKGSGERAAGVVFMSLGLVGLVRWGGGELVGGGMGLRRFDGKGMDSWKGQVLSSETWLDTRLETRTASDFHAAVNAEVDCIETEQVEIPRPKDEKHYPQQPDMQRIIGRISAWICTTLYLTSRLPQIWKNYNRKSTEGLSILLFVFAFMGNFTYMVSILINPTGDSDSSEAAHFLLEALPYLLGSGGTLAFDMTIMLQSFMYGSDKPIDEESVLNIEETDRPIRSSSRKIRKFSSSEDERQPLIRERSRDSAVLNALHHSGRKAGEGEGEHRLPPPSNGLLNSGVVTPTPGKS